MNLTVEIHHGGEWHECGSIELMDVARGYRGPSIVDYDLDYFTEFAAADYHRLGRVCDNRAMSVRYPVDLENRYLDTWPPFLLDLMPQGHARKMLSEHLGLEEGARASDFPLLLRAAGNPVGNIRIKEATREEDERLRRVVRVGVTLDDIFGRTDRFDEVVDRFAMIASGSSGLQGEWPKVALTLAKDGLYYPDVFVGDDEAVRHVIVKLLRSREERDRLILETEASYSKLAQELGLNMYEPSDYFEGVLVIPRSDRVVQRGGVLRYGQESMVSAVGVADFGYIGSHEEYIEVLRRYSNTPVEDIIEYVKRDVANRAFGNPDNHGRNTALSKHPDGRIRLAPLFDFAPMRLAIEGIPRSTRWAVMRDRHMDHAPDWRDIVDTVFPDQSGRNQLRAELATLAEKLLTAPDGARNLGVPEGVIERAMADCTAVATSILDRFVR
ncbi:HipA domain-containing protein [Sinorhizobium numidicum]|uniref:HipA domain-containing protein n=1 Tax=Sinorhizobium numidicum TaxID=680248 RepID=A0ABY8CVC8_9HYPH|nr:HipA domain-containing protein [Sinorhizobium numidicum]WEX75223.1 HipA domain-containing protein [Sinorhizobium numidicum]WEX81218.1 HipA domain-containing protein [Sinorhizobium numidicum]